MRVGIALPQYSVDVAPGRGPWLAARSIAEGAERLGLDSVWLSDHPFAVGPDGVPSGAFEALTGAAALVKATRRIQVGTLVLASTMRRAGLVAHTAATLGSRFVAGIGAGWYAPEHRAFGLDLPTYPRRLELLGSTLQALNANGVPTLIGGSSEAILDLAARHTGSWNLAWDVSPARFADLDARATGACERAGRDPGTLARSVGLTVLVARNQSGLDDAVDRLRGRAVFLSEVERRALEERIVVGTPAYCVDRIGEYAADEVISALLLRDDPEMLELFATEVAPRLR
jgi:alkanesulfonate monooxygenase